MTLHLIAFGANFGEARSTNARMVAQAAGVLRRRFGPSFRLSPLYATPAWPPGLGPDFVNAVGSLVSGMPSSSILSVLHDVEARFGRVRRERWGIRSLDLDLLASGQVIKPGAETLRHWIDLPISAQRTDSPDGLILPHPRLSERAFVLIPAAEVAPHWRHPLTGRSIAQMAAGLSITERKGIMRLRPV